MGLGSDYSRGQVMPRAGAGFAPAPAPVLKPGPSVPLAMTQLPTATTRLSGVTFIDTRKPAPSAPTLTIDRSILAARKVDVGGLASRQSAPPSGSGTPTGAPVVNVRRFSASAPASFAPAMAAPQIAPIKPVPAPFRAAGRPYSVGPSPALGSPGSSYGSPSQSTPSYGSVSQASTVDPGAMVPTSDGGGWRNSAPAPTPSPFYSQVLTGYPSLKSPAMPSAGGFQVTPVMLLIAAAAVYLLVVR